MHTRLPTFSMSSPLPRSNFHGPITSSRTRSSVSPASFLLVLILCLTFTLTLASAHPYSIPDTLIPPSDLPSSVLEELAELEAQGIVLLDTRPPPQAPNSWDLATFSGGLLKRGYVEIHARESSEPTASSSTESVPSSTVAVASSTTSETSVQETGALPSPFDSNIGANFTENACPKFITDFLATTEFQRCRPLSLLLESSTSVFTTLKSPFLTTALLDYTCSAPTTCASYLSNLATSLTESCKADLALGNPTVTMAYDGLLAYPALLSASCLKSKTGSYCFADAITNSSSTEDAYIYYLGIGQELPSDTVMTCNSCLKDVVGVFGAAAANRTLPVAAVYEAGAKVVNSVCGSGWVNETVPSALTGSAARGTFVSSFATAVVAAAIVAAVL